MIKCLTTNCRFNSETVSGNCIKTGFPNKFNLEDNNCNLFHEINFLHKIPNFFFVDESEGAIINTTFNDFKEIGDNPRFKDIIYKTEKKFKEDLKEDNVNHPKHYAFGKFEVIDVIEDWKLSYHLGNAVKYIARCKYKGNKKQDLEKAVWYLKRKIKNDKKKIRKLKEAIKQIEKEIKKK